MTMAGQMNTLKGRDNPTTKLSRAWRALGAYAGRFSVEAFAGDHVSYGASGIFHVPSSARYQVNMAVVNRLPCVRPVVHSDVEAVYGMIFFFDPTFLVIEH
jgi:hypothetical protein